jgi:hypothetical protein
MEDARSREKGDVDEMVYVDYNSKLRRQAHRALVTERLGGAFSLALPKLPSLTNQARTTRTSRNFCLDEKTVSRIGELNRRNKSKIA